MKALAVKQIRETGEREVKIVDGKRETPLILVKLEEIPKNGWHKMSTLKNV